jgi:hypothetical protein
MPNCQEYKLGLVAPLSTGLIVLATFELSAMNLVLVYRGKSKPK